MSTNKPYHRCCRQFSDGTYTEGGRWRYIIDPRYAQSPEHYIRAFLLIQKDLLKLFDYIEPSDTNMKSYSFRTHELLMRTCIEVEANCKAIFNENIYNDKEKEKVIQWSMNDYKKINTTHRLSSYKVKLPIWKGCLNVREPFKNWGYNKSLNWWQNGYNVTKHDRHNEFENANFENLIDAVCGLLIILSSQFYTEEFSSGSILLAADDYINDGMVCAIGDYFRISFPNDWPTNNRYNFDWQVLKEEKNPFDKFDYNAI